MPSTLRHTDLAIVGGGIIGLANAILAARSGFRVALYEADSAACGASIRNFGLITVSGQAQGDVWRLSRRSRDIWDQIADEAGLPILQRGMVMAAQSPEAATVLEAFLATPMGSDCATLSPKHAGRHVPMLRQACIETAALSPHELRVDPRMALPALTAYAKALGVNVQFAAPVAGVQPGQIRLASGETRQAERILVCAGGLSGRLAPPELASRMPHCTKLHMMRLRPRAEIRSLEIPAISDLTLARYPGFADLPQARALKTRLQVNDAEMLADGIHVIAVRNQDGTVTIGDSHRDFFSDTADPFQPADVDGKILEAANRFLDLEGAKVLERWTGFYPKAKSGEWLIEETAQGVWFAAVLGGKGMTLSFGFAERVLERAGLLRGATR